MNAYGCRQTAGAVVEVSMRYQPADGPIITQHAIDRAVQRLGLTRERARSDLADAWTRAIRLPARVARRFERRLSLEHRQVLICGTWVLLCARRHVITCWRVDDDMMGTVILWAATGFLLPEDS